MKIETHLALSELRSDIDRSDLLDKIYMGDCLQLLPLLPTASVNMILCDLPYGVTARNGWDKVIPIEPLWKEYRRIIKPDGVIVLTGQGLFSAKLMLAAPDMYKFSLIWKKNKPRGHLNAKKQPLRTHEDILVFYKSQPIYNPQMAQGHAPMHAAHNKQSGSNYNAAKGVPTEGGRTDRYPISVI
jgi:site-specific DNA-methyltransferase (adenine-specific)